MSEFKEIRNHLIDMLEDLDERLTSITNDGNHSDEPAIKAFEDEDEDEDNEDFDSFEHISIQEMEKIKLAISCIDSETYGKCLTCGIEIKKKELHKNPLARLCIHCAEKKNGNKS